MSELQCTEVGRWLQYMIYDPHFKVSFFFFFFKKKRLQT